MFFNTMFNNFPPFSTYADFPCRAQPKTETYSNRNDIRSIICNKLFNDSNNFYCFDCRRQTNSIKYFDLKNAIFLCYNCALQHAKLPKEISGVMTGDIRSLEERQLLPFYYGGNNNLIEFIRKYYPLLERMEKYKMYSTKAMEYYRKLLCHRAYNEPQPDMPRKLEGYNSIFFTSGGANDDDEKKPKNNKKKETMDIESNSSKNLYKDEEDIEMKEETTNTRENSVSSEDSEDSDMDNKEEKKEKSRDKKNIENEGNIKAKIEVRDLNCLNLNQLGDINNYPEAKEFDGFDCE